MSERLAQFEAFEEVVEGHIEQYTVPQYGDMPDDQASAWPPEQCIESIKRYVNRFGSGRRGRVESLRDMLKIAHYACIIFYKMEPDIAEIRELKGGNNAVSKRRNG